jgi:hypothetical protein
MVITLEEKPKGTCSFVIFHISWGSTLCTESELQSDLTVGDVPSLDTVLSSKFYFLLYAYAIFINATRFAFLSNIQSKTSWMSSCMMTHCWKRCDKENDVIFDMNSAKKGSELTSDWFSKLLIYAEKFLKKYLAYEFVFLDFKLLGIFQAPLFLYYESCAPSTEFNTSIKHTAISYK